MVHTFPHILNYANFNDIGQSKEQRDKLGSDHSYTHWWLDLQISAF